MTLAVIARAIQAGLAKFGGASTLDGVAAGNVHIERGVEMFVGDPGRSDDNSISHVDVAVCPVTAVTGQVLVHPEGRYRLMRLVEDNGYSRHFIIVAAPL
jgi:hypothetical protein